MKRFSKESNHHRPHLIVEDKIDAVFRRIKPNFIGFHVWKLENDRIETVPSDQCGIFHDRDTYIVYAAAVADTFVTPKTVSREVKSALPLRRYVHFWLGAATTPERSGAVAYKVIELDNHLGNVAVQYRESQSHESTRFQSYFKEGRIILSDQHADPVRLFEVRGKISPTCTQCPVAWSSFSSSSTMLFQTQSHVFVWLGRLCSQTERRHGLRMAQRIQQLYGIKTVTAVDDGYEQSMAAPSKAEWNQHLSLGQRHVHQGVRSLDSGGGLTAGGPMGGTAAVPPMKLYKCGLLAGKYRIEEMKTGGLVQADLDDSSAAYIVDCGEDRGVWIWLGRSCMRKDKAEAMRNARGFVKKKQYDSTTPVVRCIEAHEPPEFQQLFPYWRAQPQHAVKTTASAHNLLLTGKFDAHTLSQRPRLAATLQLIDDGAGCLTVYKVHKGNLLEIVAPNGGNGSAGARLRALFAGDCFVLHYAVVNSAANNLASPPQVPRFRHILYLWIGSQSNVEQRSQAAALAAELYDHLQGGAMLVRVAEGHEPPQLLQAFGGRLAIFNGKSDDFDSSGACRQLPAAYLLKVSGAVTYAARALQVLAKTAHITSRDCLVLATSAGTVWVWCGQGSTGDAREMAKTVGAAATMGDTDYVLALEGSEPDAFWQCLPDQLESKLRMAHTTTDATVANGGDVIEQQTADASATVGLYAVSTAAVSDEVSFRQIVAFAQADLMPEDVYVLDAGCVVYVWLGDLCLPSERKACWHIAQSYLASSVPARSKDTTIALVRQGAEPISFVGYFDEWNTQLWASHQTVDDQRAAIDRTHCSSSSNGSSGTTTHSNGLEEAEFNRFAKYPLDLLRADAADLPELVNPMRKEMHLTHDDFVAVFAMPVAVFEALPGWRKQELKKRHKLF